MREISGSIRVPIDHDSSLPLNAVPVTSPLPQPKRGMVEFVVPSGGKISAVDLRAKADGTLTTIPALTK